MTEQDTLQKAERLWRELQENELGGYSGINRPFWIKTYLDAEREAANERIARLEGVVDAVIRARETKRKSASYNAPSRDVAEALVAEEALVEALAALSAIAPTLNTAGPQE